MSSTAPRPDTSYFLRKLHSFTGVLPVGAFLAEHFWSNSAALVNAAKYDEVSRELQTIPFRPFVEWGVIFLPMLFHAVYGVYIWVRGKSNVSAYPWVGNWLYTAQRWTGIVALIYIAQHTYYLRFTGVHLPTHPEAAFAKVQGEFQNPWMIAFYAVGIIAASWHFAYGLWLFAAKWGITTGERARRRFGYICFALALGLIAIGAASMYGFLKTPDHRSDQSTNDNIVMR